MVFAWVFHAHLGADGRMHSDKRICRGVVVGDTMTIPGWCDSDLSDRVVVIHGRTVRIVGVSPDHVLYLKESNASSLSPLDRP